MREEIKITTVRSLKNRLFIKRAIAAFMPLGRRESFKPICDFLL